jgi:hypothetical protein
MDLGLNGDAATATVPGLLVVCRSGMHGNSELTTRQESLGMGPAPPRAAESLLLSFSCLIVKI